jgi:hypothetical protein
MYIHGGSFGASGRAYASADMSELVIAGQIRATYPLVQIAAVDTKKEIESGFSVFFFLIGILIWGLIFFLVAGVLGFLVAMVVSYFGGKTKSTRNIASFEFLDGKKLEAVYKDSEMKKILSAMAEQKSDGSQFQQ